MKNYSNQVFLMLALALLGMSAYAVTYDQYPLGVYSYLCTQAFDENEIEQSISLIKDMGYNVVQITNHRSSNPLGNILAMLQNDSLYAIVADLDYPTTSVSTNNNDYNTTALTTSSYLKFEAEFSGSDDIDFGNEDMNWYCSHDESYEPEGIPITFPRVGNTIPDGSLIVWACQSNTTDPGYAYTDIRWRWLHNGYAENKRLGDEFYIYHDQRGESDTPSSNQSRYLHIRFKVRLENFAPSITGITPLLSFTTRGETANGTVYVNHSCDYDPTSYFTTTFHYEDFLASGSPMGYFDIEIKISYADLLSLNLISAVREFRYVLENLNPWVYWHGNCDLYLDYIEYEDQMHYDMMNDVTGYTTNINNRIDYLQSLNGNDIIKHMYSRCEPKLGQFHSYDRVHTYIANSGVPIPNPNIITAAYDTDHRKIPMPSGKYYDHVRCFMDSVKPEIILPDIYPVKPLTDYNSDDTTNPNAFQTRVDDQLIYQYKQTRLKCNEETPRTTFIPIVQAFGEWRESSWVSWALPPAETIKCLKYLPLCYDPDGIIDFRVTHLLSGSIGNNASGQYCSIMKDINGLILDTNPTREAVIEANEKIGVIGPMIKHDMTWLGGGCLNVGSETADDMLQANLPGKGISSLQVEDPHDGWYSGYIHCGLYEDDENPEITYFVLVNRRANYSLIDGYTTQTTPPSEYDSHYISANPQSARFELTNLAHNRFGTFLAVHDLYDSELFIADEDTIRVSIEPGECRLVEIVGTLPSFLNDNATLNNTAVLEGVITMADGTYVNTLAGTNVTILPNTLFVLEGDAQINLRGTITIGDSVSFVISPNARVNFIDSECTVEGKINIIGYGSLCVYGSSSITYLQNSEMNISNGAVVTLSGVHNYMNYSEINLSGQSTLIYSNVNLSFGLGSILTSDNSTLSLSSVLMSNSPSRKANFYLNNLSDLSIINSTIGSIAVSVNCSDLFFEDSMFYVPYNSAGISVSNPFTNRHVRIVGNQRRNVFSTGTQNMTKGLDITITHSPVVIQNTDFYGFQYGILKSTSTTVPDSISNCTFSDCIYGVYETSSGACGKIENSSFSNISSCGIVLIGSIPTIANCTFEGCNRGVFFDGSFYSPRESGIYSSSFSYCDTAIESRSANPRVQNCTFHMNEIGLLCHNDSNMNLCLDASNRFTNLNSNIKFYWDDMYHSYIQLTTGHNDFFHFGTNTYDIEFDANYSSSTGYAINATKNWFESDTLLVNNPAYNSYVIVMVYDAEPNTIGTDPDGDIRYLLALHREAIGQFVAASDMYKNIINEQLECEKDYLNGCLDGIFRIELIEDILLDSLAIYFEEKFDQYALIDSSYARLLNSYLVKTHVARKDFQSAINLLQERIDNPVNIVDSLRAVLDIEIVLQLATLEENKKPITTKYTQYRYQSTGEFRSKHDQTLQSLYKAMVKDNVPDIPIPEMPLISNNYPNPFNPSTTVSFSIPSDTRIKMNVYNLRGQSVKKLLDSDFKKGHHQIVWNGRDDNNRNVGSGIYFIRLESQGKVHTRKVMLMK